MMKRIRTAVKPKAMMTYTREEDKEVDDLVDTADPERPGCRLGEITWTSFTSADVTFLMASLLIITTSCSVRLGTDPEKCMRATRVLVRTRTDHWFLVSHVAGYHEDLKPRPNDRNISTQHIPTLLAQHLQAPAKRSQHYSTTDRNIVGRNMLNAFGHPVATCGDMLGIENRTSAHARVQHCCTNLAKRPQHHATFEDVA